MQIMRSIDAKVLELEKEIEELKATVASQSHILNKMADTIDKLARIVLNEDDGK